MRPYVDPEDLGEVDPTKYPEPKESDRKIRGKTDLIEAIFENFNSEFLVVKSFYFFFYSAFGSLFPLMGIYFKQMGMTAAQTGVLIGIRPFIDFVSAPFWGSLAGRWERTKLLLLLSLAAWIFFTVPLSFVQPPATSCLKVIEANQSTYLKSPDVPLMRIARGLPGPMRAGQSPISVQSAINYDQTENKDWVRPVMSSIVYRTPDIQKTFFLLLLLIILGEWLSAPAITLADAAVLNLLGDDADRYGYQRMFGSLGWGISMFFVGIALDHSTAFPDHPCGPVIKEKNYSICFATFSVLMGAALISATQINFRGKITFGGGEAGSNTLNEEEQQQQQQQQQPNPQFEMNSSGAVVMEMTYEDQMQSQLAEQLQLPSLRTTGTPMPNNGPMGANSRAVYSSKTQTTKTEIFAAQTMTEMPEWMTVFKHLESPKSASFLFVAWFMGIGVGLIFTFLFWHLQDFGGSPTLFGVASVINHVSEICAYFFSFRLIRQMGHAKVLCIGLIGNVIRFFYISMLQNPWWVLPFEFVQGITHATVWAACSSFIAHATPQPLRASAQGVLQGLHHGLGRGFGAIFGGMLVTKFGTTVIFRYYAILCALVLAVFIFIHFKSKDGGFLSELPDTEDPRQVAEEAAHLAPHGVPSNPIPRALSSSRLSQTPDAASANQQFQMPAENKPNNPFLMP